MNNRLLQDLSCLLDARCALGRVCSAGFTVLLSQQTCSMVYGQLKSILWIDKHVTYTFEVRDEMRYSKRKLLIRIEQADL